MQIHALFDVLAWVSAALVAIALRRFASDAFPTAGARSRGYLAALIVGAALGAYLLGTLNLWLAGLPGVARSIEGALAGAVLAVELYKWRQGIVGRTAALYALPLAIAIAVGRVGCFLAGIDDFTYGLPTSLPWAHDFGDGIPRHPVQLYESIGMLLFALGYLLALVRRQTWVVDNGFALLLLTYALLRFGLEKLKPYPDVIGGLTVFQIVCLAMLGYALFLIRPREVSRERRA